MPLSRENPACVIEGVLAGDVFRDLLGSLDRITESDYECPDRPEALTQGTYWMPAAASRTPGNAVERYIARVSGSPDFLEATGGGFLGAEWWWQDTDADDPPKAYHTDCDLRLAGEGHVKVHPEVSSVFYTSADGGPTVVFDQEVVAGDLHPAAPSCAVLSFPHEAQLLLFCGSLQHGVLHPPPSHPFPEGGRRLTLLVNWWRARPNGPHDLPDVFNTEGRPHVADAPEVQWEPAAPLRIGVPKPLPAGGGLAAADADSYEAYRIPAAVEAALGGDAPLPPAVAVAYSTE